MPEAGTPIQRCEEEVDKALWSLERKDKVKEALAAYREVEATLDTLDVDPGDEFAEKQRVLAYCLMRQGNALRQLGQAQQALELAKREIAAARASGDDVALARSLMSNGVNHIVASKVQQGLDMLDEARMQFAQGDSYDHRQGLGWSWILRADLINAGLLEAAPADVIEAADAALEILMPIGNWAGVARAHGAKAQAYETLGDADAAAAESEAQQEYDRRSEAEEGEA